MTSKASSPANDSQGRTLPKDFVKMLAGYRDLNGLAEVLATTSPSVSVRVNRSKGAMPGNDTVAWCADGFYLAERPDFSLDPALHQGRYYVQDASSMIFSRLAQIFSNGHPVRWLDACAAPGGKTTAVLASLAEGSLVVANEYDRRRAAALIENIERWGNPSVVVTHGDTAKFRKLQDFFDVVAVDAPCSGEGMMRKEAVAVEQWSSRLVDSCAATQCEIIDNVWPALRPGGVLIYSTCTFNTIEDEDMLRYIVDHYDAEPIDTGLAGQFGISGAITGEIPALRFLPGRIRGEGLFVGVIRKGGESDAPRSLRSITPKKAKDIAPANWFDGQFIQSVDSESHVRAIPVANFNNIRRIFDTLPAGSILRAGLEAATVKGRDVIPSFALAMSSALNRDAFPTCEVDYPTALTYLRGEAVTLDDAQRGIVLLTYGGYPLGFVKNLGNRANNLLPANRRLHLRVTPPEPPQILG